MSEKKTPAIRFQGFTDDWEQRKVSDICSISTGKSNTQDKEDDGIYPFYVRSPIIEHSNKYLYDEEAVLTVGDGVGTGKVFHYVNGKYNLHQRVYRMYGFSDDISAKFFYQCFSEEFYNRVMAMTAKTSVDSVRYKMIADMDIQLPSKAEQDKIAKSLFSLDGLISLHQRKLTKLQLLKTSMLTKMFPKDGARVPEIRFQGFHGDWEHYTLRDISDIKTGPFGSALHADDYVSEGVPIITTEHFKSGHLPTSKTGIPQVSREDYARLSSYILNIGDIVFSRVGSVDINALVTQAQSRWLFSGRVLRVRIKDLTDAGFLHIALETSHVRNDIISRAVGQTMPCINTEILGDTLVLMPMSISEQKQIAQYFSHLERLIISHQQNLSKLQQIKQAMLSKLFV